MSKTEDEYIEIVITELKGDIFMSMLGWAKKEVEIACKRENPDRKEGEFDYGCACYESALKAFESLCEDGHSGMSIGVTKNILNWLIDGKPLTPIEDTDDIWKECTELSDECRRAYRCMRMSSLFKMIYNDGYVKYTDVDRYYCKDIDNPIVSYTSGLVTRIVDEMFPITMPYSPGPSIIVFCEDFLTDRKNGDYDTKAILYALKYDENGDQKRIEINRFFRVSVGDETGSWTEISKEEYEERKTRRLN